MTKLARITNSVAHLKNHGAIKANFGLRHDDSLAIERHGQDIFHAVAEWYQFLGKTSILNTQYLHYLKKP